MDFNLKITSCMGLYLKNSFIFYVLIRDMLKPHVKGFEQNFGCIKLHYCPYFLFMFSFNYRVKNGHFMKFWLTMKVLLIGSLDETLSKRTIML